MSTVQYVISIDWQTILGLTIGALVCIFTYCRLTYSEDDE